MSYIIKKIGKTYNTPTYFFECDNTSDIKEIPTNMVPMGSRCHVINEAQEYVLDSAGQWRSVKNGEILILPDGEEVIGSDTLTWDGNTVGLEHVNAFNGYKVSDAVLTEENLLNASLLITYESGVHEPTGEMTMSKPFEGAIVYGTSPNDTYIVVINDVIAAQLGASAGTYFIIEDNGSYVSSLTIPGYTGFVSK